MDSNTQDDTANDQDDQEDLLNKIKKLELDNAQIREEFNVQRAKMKELFLQKEEELKRRLEENLQLRDEKDKLKSELDETKSQLVVADFKIQNDMLLEQRKAQEEIASLQQVITETVEESSCARHQLDAELNKLRIRIARLQEENAAIRSQIAREPPTDGPQISLSTVTKTLARKVVSQLGADSLSLGPDNLEESMRKVKRYAQEDAEVLRSLVGPLEEEIKALKEKLRSTDDELQKCKEAQLQRKHPEPGAPSCDMCVNYEEQLVMEQTKVKEVEKELLETERMLQGQKEDLAKEVEFRKEMEEKWNEKKEEHKIKVAELSAASETAHRTLSELRETFRQVHLRVNEKLWQLTRDRESVQQHLNALQKENENLVGKHSKHSQQLQSESINMPNNVEDLHVTLLKMREDLITAKVAQEDAQEKAGALRYEVGLLRDQMEQDNRSKEQRITLLQNEVDQLKTHLEKYVREHTDREDKLQRIEKHLEQTLSEKKEVDSAVAELRQRVTNLQQELDTSEEVQKDFVRLSQSLQVQLEKIREAGSEVRWQHEEDVDECPGCHINFTAAKRKEKVHCRHCGHIFCQSCLSRVVESGPKRRPSRVCDVCHTLLVRESAPYFSKQPPRTPD